MLAALAALAAPLVAWTVPAAASPGSSSENAAVADPSDDAPAKDAPASDGDAGPTPAPAATNEAPNDGPSDTDVEAKVDAAPAPAVTDQATIAAKDDAPIRAVEAPPGSRGTPAPSAAAAEAPAPARATQSMSLVMARAEAAPATPWVGAMADLGLPDGATLSLVVRPIRSIRAHAGLSHNMISLGERVGVTWVPLSWWASPTLSVEYGHYADGNANPLVRMVSGDPSFSSAVLDRVGYDYANAHVGLELGRRWFTFYVHAGMSRITGAVHNLTAETMSDSGTATVSFGKDPTVRLWTVSARIGFIVYLAK
jgi:hypothetical protein